MNKLDVTKQEYAYLKAITLFSTGHVKAQHRSQIHRFQTRAVADLREYESKTNPDDHDRLSNLLLTLPNIRSMSSQITEELFFAGLIGNVQIDSIIPYILQMDAAGGSSNLSTTSSPPTSSQSSNKHYTTSSSNEEDISRKYVNGLMSATKVETSTAGGSTSPFSLLRAGSSAAVSVAQERFLLPTSLD